MFLPHQQMMLSNCISPGSMQETEKTLSISIISIRKRFNRELDIFKTIVRAGTPKIRKLPPIVFFCFKVTPPQLWPRGIELLPCHLCAPYSQASNHSVECGRHLGTENNSILRSLLISWHLLYSLIMNISLVTCNSHPSYKLEKSLRNVIFSLPALFVWIDGKDKKKWKWMLNKEY